MDVTRDNFERLLDAGLLVCSGNGWKIRRNGQTQKWKRDAKRIRVPIKFGFRSCDAITEHSFGQSDGVALGFRVDPTQIAYAEVVGKYDIMCELQRGRVLS